MSPPLTIATTDYDHFRDFRLGLVRAESIEANWLTLGHHEIFLRFTFNREWDVPELSFAKFAAQVTRENSDIIGLPVYASRLFRFSSFYVNKKKGIKTAKDLRGKRIGVPEWAHTAAVYMRGWLMHEGGVALSDIDWVQAANADLTVALSRAPAAYKIYVRSASFSEQDAAALFVVIWNSARKDARQSGFGREFAARN
jgi:4,5-dihydroxyphthalate decarboxylase